MTGRLTRGGQGPRRRCQVLTISSRRRGQSAAALTTLPSANVKGDRYEPNLPANSRGGCANGSSFFHRASDEVGCADATMVSTATSKVASRKMDRNPCPRRGGL